MKNKFIKFLIIFVLFILTSIRANAVEFNVLVLPTNLFNICENYFCFPEASEIVSQDVIAYMNSYKNIHATNLSVVRATLNQDYELKNQTEIMLANYRNNNKIDFSTLKQLSAKFGVKSVVIISSYAVTDKTDLKRDLWDVLELSNAFQFTYPFQLKINCVLTDTVNDVVMWSNKYSKDLSDSQGYFRASNQAQAISALEKIKEYSRTNIAQNISQNIHLRFFPKEVRTFNLIKPELRGANTFVPNALEKLSEPRLQKESESRNIDYSMGEDIFSF